MIKRLPVVSKGSRPTIAATAVRNAPPKQRAKASGNWCWRHVSATWKLFNDTNHLLSTLTHVTFMHLKVPSQCTRVENDCHRSQKNFVQVENDFISVDDSSENSPEYQEGQTCTEFNDCQSLALEEVHAGCPNPRGLRDYCVPGQAAWKPQQVRASDYQVVFRFGNSFLLVRFDDV